MPISYFKDTFNKDSTVTSEESIMENIISDTWKSNVEYLRSLNKAEYDAEKKKMPCVTWSGVFQKGTRLIESITSYSGLVVIDVDKLEASVIPVLKTQLLGDEYVRFCFTSPSGKGIKIIVKVNTLADGHRSAFLHLQHYFENKYLIKVDTSGKDVCRLCYVSCDPQAVINLNSTVFEVDMKYGAIITEYRTTFEGARDIHDADKIYPVCVKWIEKKFTYSEGQRNVFLHALACAMNRCGVKQAETIRIIYANYKVPDDKWIQSVRSAYFHGQHEHGVYQIKDVGRTEFIAPDYVGSFSDDVAGNDIMHITSVLYNHKVPNNEIMHTVSKIWHLYDHLGYIDVRRKNLAEMMNEAIMTLRANSAGNASLNALAYVSAEEMINKILDYGTSENAISTGITELDSEMFGGMLPGNLYGLIGMGESFKSVLAQYICFINAKKGIPSLYNNGEMSLSQWYERFIYMVFGIDLRQNVEDGVISKANVADFIRQVTDITKNNIFVVNDSGFTKTNILSTIDHIANTTGKKIKLVISDGLTQWDWAGQQEIMATINNSMHAKNTAKEAHGGEGVVHIALIHISGDIKRWYRDTGSYVRGGKKVLANLDAYFCTSRLIDPSTNQMVNEDDVKFLPGKFYLRYVDKRSKTGIVNNIINVGGSLQLEVEKVNPESYELKINKN